MYFPKCGMQNSADERTYLEKEILRTDKEIDELVYGLYNIIKKKRK